MNLEQKINEWLGPQFDAATQQTILDLQTHNPKELEDCFYKNLEFGTGGMRGVMGVGTNRISRYTLGKNTQGLAQYMHKAFPGQSLKVAIAYDCRHNSDTLAQVVAEVLSANQVQVYLFEALRPTPELSFTVKHLGCHAGIVLTASHNPPEYNGYKVYWQDGGQLVPPQDAEIISEIEALQYADVRFEAQPALIQRIGSEVDEAFIQSTIDNAGFDTPLAARQALQIAYTSLHGTSITMIPKVLERAGYTQLHIVAEQAEPNGDFPTVVSPNPEEPEALTMALALADQVQADLVIGTDPDSDRLGVAVRNAEGQMQLLNGNQTMVLMTAYLLEQWKKADKIKGKEFIGSTIVSTPMMFDLAEAYGVECKVGLTGFKWIAKMIRDFDHLSFIGGGEESFGFMVGDAVRDKDAVGATLLICEMAAQAKAKGSSLWNELTQLYLQFGYYKEHLVSITKKGKEGAALIQQMMHNMRENPVATLAGQRVVCIEDYQQSRMRNLITGEQAALDIPKSNVLIYYLEDGSKICARPSGTEPKIKFYFSVQAPLASAEDMPALDKDLGAHIQQIMNELQLN